jgi:hypothetical protein
MGRNSNLGSVATAARTSATHFQLHRQCKEWKECQSNIPQMPHSFRILRGRWFQAEAWRPFNKPGHGWWHWEWFSSSIGWTLGADCLVISTTILGGAILPQYHPSRTIYWVRKNKMAMIQLTRIEDRLKPGRGVTSCIIRIWITSRAWRE